MDASCSQKLRILALGSAKHSTVLENSAALQRADRALAQHPFRAVKKGGLYGTTHATTPQEPLKGQACQNEAQIPQPSTYLWLVGNGRMVVIVVIIVPHSSIPF